MSDDNYCIEEDLEESMQREKRLEELIEEMHHMLLKLCIAGHDLCLKYGSCNNCPIAEILKKAREK